MLISQDFSFGYTPPAALSSGSYSLEYQFGTNGTHIASSSDSGGVIAAAGYSTSDDFVSGDNHALVGLEASGLAAGFESVLELDSDNTAVIGYIPAGGARADSGNATDIIGYVGLRSPTTSRTTQLKALIEELFDYIASTLGSASYTGTTTDGVDVGDAVSAVATRLASAVEGVDIGDAFSALTSGGSAGTTEGVDIGDAFSAVRARVGSVLDGLKLGDTPSAVAQGASSSPLFIGASLVAVTRHSCRYEPLGASVIRNYRGACLSAITTARGFFRVWKFDTPNMTSAVAASFEADISTGDLFTVTGYLVGSSAVTVAIANIQREDSALYSRYSFELIESV